MKNQPTFSQFSNIRTTPRLSLPDLKPIICQHWKPGKEWGQRLLSSVWIFHGSTFLSRALGAVVFHTEISSSHFYLFQTGTHNAPWMWSVFFFSSCVMEMWWVLKRGKLKSTFEQQNHKTSSSCFVLIVHSAPTNPDEISVFCQLDAQVALCQSSLKEGLKDEHQQACLSFSLSSTFVHCLRHNKAVHFSRPFFSPFHAR